MNTFHHLNADRSSEDLVIPTDPEAYLNERQAAALIGYSVGTLRSLRVKGGGPAYCKATRRVTYQRRELLSWARARTVLHTSEAVDK